MLKIYTIIALLFFSVAHKHSFAMEKPQINSELGCTQSRTEELMERFLDEVVLFARENAINSPRERLALLLSLQMVHACEKIASAAAKNVVWGAAREALAAAGAGDLNWTDEWDAAGTEVIDAAQTSLLSQASNALLTLNFYTLDRADLCAEPTILAIPWIASAKSSSREGRLAVRAAAYDKKRPAHHIGAIAYRAAEITTLKNFMLNPSALRAAYFGLLERLGQNGPNNPFESEKAWCDYRAANFADLSPELLIYLNPWLGVLDSLMYTPAILEFQKCRTRKESPVSWMPRDIVKLISRLVAMPLYAGNRSNK